MAATKGHGNPLWNRDETLLALELYHAVGEFIPSPQDPRVVALSETLKALPFHPLAKRKASFRNPDGVAFKLQNIRYVATGKGLDSKSKNDEAVWSEFGARPEEVKILARAIREAVKMLGPSVADAEENLEFKEGRALTVMHQRRERHPGLRAALLRTRKKAGRLHCEICQRAPLPDLPELEDSIFEGHHCVAISTLGERVTRLTEMALLCANCHRALHRAIVRSKRWILIEEARGIFGTQMRA